MSNKTGGIFYRQEFIKTIGKKRQQLGKKNLEEGSIEIYTSK